MIGVVPFQVPDDAVSVCPCVGVPEIVGGTLFDGVAAGKNYRLCTRIRKSAQLARVSETGGRGV